MPVTVFDKLSAVSSIYVASASEQLSLVEHYVDRLREQSFVITYEWTKDIREGGFKPDSELSETYRRYAARMDAHGVQSCDILWVLTPPRKDQGCGMWVELGLGIAQKKRVIVSGPLARRSVFTELCEARFDDHEDAFKYIVGDESVRR